MRAILLDIEGTTTPIRFVYDVLFPYARRHLGEYLDRYRDDPDLLPDLQSLRHEYEEELLRTIEPIAWNPAAYCLRLMDQDRKSTALKSIQGKVWRIGYETGQLKGEVYPDVPPALHRWRLEGLAVSIYSSGSALAQRLLFANTAAGDLTQYLTGYFDTNVGSKISAESYRCIATKTGIEPGDIVFASDVTAELDAAREAGMATLLCIRPGNPKQPDHSYTVIHHFDKLTDQLRS